MPYVFTEQGIAMLSGLLKNEIAVKVSISASLKDLGKKCFGINKMEDINFISKKD